LPFDFQINIHNSREARQPRLKCGHVQGATTEEGRLLRRGKARLGLPLRPHDHDHDDTARVKELRERWKKWQGDDCLHASAFGEPIDRDAYEDRWKRNETELNQL